MKIVLIGFMGSGKSTVARLLAETLGMPVLEVDDHIVAASGRASIAEIFEKDGESVFRDLETRIILHTASTFRGIVSAGGGAILRDENVTALRRGSGVFIHLLTTFDEIARRLAATCDRPLWDGGVKSRLLFESRAPRFAALAQEVVSTDGLTPQEVARKIVAYVGRDRCADVL